MAQQALEIKNRILEYVKRNGPILPVKISKELGSNTIFAGAILSQLIAEKHILITYGKVGGSPLYYVSGQENKLEILANYMNDKEKKAFFILKENKILRDKALEPWQRVALRELKDFAVMLKVIDDNKDEEIFWKWFSVPDNESEVLIKGIVGYRENIIGEKVNENIIEKPVLEKTEVQAVINNTEESLKPLIENKKIRTGGKKEAKLERTERKKENNFKDDINNYFSKKNIAFIEENMIKKNSEYDFICNIPSHIGSVRFFVKVKSKKNIGDADLLLAHSQSRLKGLPLLYLSNGGLSKKGKDYLIKNNLVFEKI